MKPHPPQLGKLTLLAVLLALTPLRADLLLQIAPTAPSACCDNLVVNLLGGVANVSGCSKVISQTWEATDCCGTT